MPGYWACEGLFICPHMPKSFLWHLNNLFQVIIRVMHLRAFLLILFSFLLFACQSTQQAEPTPFRPPAAVDTPVPTQLPAGNPASTSPPPIVNCTDVLVFLEDVTIPDGTLAVPGEPLDKRWKVRNDGTCNWEEGYALRLISGPAMGASELQALYPARSGTEALIRMEFTAPSESGLYRTAWQAYNPDGERFGDPFYMEIMVP